MKEEIKAGLTNTASVTVTDENTAEKLGSGTLRVFATPAMIALIEGCCAASVERLLPEGVTSVGTHLDIEHVSASPVGAVITCDSTLLSFDGRRLEFEVSVTDDKGLVGRGNHTRFTVKSESFLKKTYAKIETA